MPPKDPIGPPAREEGSHTTQLLQRSKAPLRIIFRLSKLKFFPVTTTKYTKLEDLNGEPILLHSRGGGTDSIANVIEARMGMEFGERSYVPGSSNRVAALLGGQAEATIIDLSNKNKLMRSEAASGFNMLEMFDVEASDEALFGNLDWIQNNEADVQIFVNALLSVYKHMADDHSPRNRSRWSDRSTPRRDLGRA